MTAELSAWTRATTVTKTLSDTTALDKWKRRMVATGFARRPDLISIAAASTGDKQALDAVCEDAMTAAGAGDRATRGTDLHTLTELVDTDRDLPADLDTAAVEDLAAYITTTRAYGVGMLPEFIERVVVNPAVEVAGTFDRVVEVTRPWAVTMPGATDEVVLAPGDRLIADLKTGSNLSYSWGEIAQQLAIYAHAPLIWRNRAAERDRWGRYLLPDLAKHRDAYEDMPAVNDSFGLVIHLPAGEARCSLYLVDIGAGWEAAQLAHQVRSWRTRRDLVGAVQLKTLSEVSSVARP